MAADDLIWHVLTTHKAFAAVGVAGYVLFCFVVWLALSVVPPLG